MEMPPRLNGCFTGPASVKRNPRSPVPVDLDPCPTTTLSPSFPANTDTVHAFL